MTLKQQRILGKIRSEIAIEELWEGYLLSIFKSSLFHNRRSKECNHGKQDANRAVFHNRREYFIEVHTLSLTIALCNQACEELLIQRLRSSVLTLSSKQAIALPRGRSKPSMLYKQQFKGKQSTQLLL